MPVLCLLVLVPVCCKYSVEAIECENDVNYVMPVCKGQQPWYFSLGNLLLIAHDQNSGGVYPYLPLATNAPRTIFGGHFIKSLTNFSIQKSI